MIGAYRLVTEIEVIEGIEVEHGERVWVDTAEPRCELCCDFQEWVDEDSVVVPCPECADLDPVMAD